VLVSTHHGAFDWATIAKHSALVVDTRDALRAYDKDMAGRLVRA
jgi:hypothetical protein